MKQHEATRGAVVSQHDKTRGVIKAEHEETRGGLAVLQQAVQQGQEKLQQGQETLQQGNQQGFSALQHGNVMMLEMILKAQQMDQEQEAAAQSSTVPNPGVAPSPVPAESPRGSTDNQATGWRQGTRDDITGASEEEPITVRFLENGTYVYTNVLAYTKNGRGKLPFPHKRCFAKDLEVHQQN